MPDDSNNDVRAAAGGHAEVELLLRRAGLPASSQEIDDLVEVYSTARGMAEQMYALQIEGAIR